MKINAFYGAKARNVDTRSIETLPNKTPVTFVAWSQGKIDRHPFDNGDRIIVSTGDGTRFNVLASQVSDE